MGALTDSLEKISAISPTKSRKLIRGLLKGVGKDADAAWHAEAQKEMRLLHAKLEAVRSNKNLSGWRREEKMRQLLDTWRNKPGRTGKKTLNRWIEEYKSNFHGMHKRFQPHMDLSAKVKAAKEAERKAWRYDPRRG
jgi:uncharacterized membrane protein